MPDYSNGKLYTIRNRNGWTNWYLELYQKISCRSKEELLKRAGEVLRLIGALNMLIAGRDQKEYRLAAPAERWGGFGTCAQSGQQGDRRTQAVPGYSPAQRLSA